MDKFWDVLKHSSAFSFYFDEEGILLFSARDDSAGIECDTGGSR